MSAPPASTATVGPPACSAPSCAALSIPSAIPLTTVTPAAASPRPSDRAISSPSGDAWRVPTTAIAGPPGSAAPPPARQRAAPGDDRRGGAVVAQRRRVIVVVATDGAEAGQLVGRPLLVQAEPLELAHGASDLRRRHGGQEILVGEREHLRQSLSFMTGELDPAGEPRDEPCPAQARVAGADAAGHAASPEAAPASWRMPIARSRCSLVIASLAARSAIVRATRSTRSRPRADNVPRS